MSKRSLRRRSALPARARRRSTRIAVAFAAAAGLAASFNALHAGYSPTRTISIHNIHTNETLTIEYKRDGKYLPDALAKINWIMRDWRKNEETTIDPKLVDLLWEVHTELGSKVPIELVCGYRSRSTNEMLRRTVGGQASESRHILGKAADVFFPDVKLSDLRYAGLLHEQGGVGYYPTSGTPFVHLDTDRVRAWPRLPRFELALLFRSGHTQHVPADGNPLTPEDVKVALGKYPDLSLHVASLITGHVNPGQPQVAVASADLKIPPLASAFAAPAPAPAPIPVAAAKPAPSAAPPLKVAALEPAPKPAVAAAPRLMSEPRVVDRPSKLAPGPNPKDRAGLTALLVGLTETAAPAPQLVREPAPAIRPSLASLAGPPALRQVPPSAPASAAARPRVVASIPPGLAASPAAAPSLTDAPRAATDPSWAEAPAFDEEHPEELAYHPFPVTPFLTLSASADDPALAVLIHPDVPATLDMLNSAGSMPPMKLRPGYETAKLLWAQQFRGEAVDLSALEAPAVAGSDAGSRKVRTSGL